MTKRRRLADRLERGAHEPASEREPRIGEHGVVARGVVGAAEIRTVEVARAPVEMQIFGELQAEAHVPFRIEKRGAVAEGDVTEIEDQAVAVRAADRTAVERAKIDGDAGRVGAGPVEKAVARAADIEIAEAEAVGVIPDKRSIGLEAVQPIVDVRRVLQKRTGVQALALDNVGQLDGKTVLVAVVLVLRV